MAAIPPRCLAHLWKEPSRQNLSPAVLFKPGLWFTGPTLRMLRLRPRLPGQLRGPPVPRRAQSLPASFEKTEVWASNGIWVNRWVRIRYNTQAPAGCALTRVVDACRGQRSLRLGGRGRGSSGFRLGVSLGWGWVRFRVRAHLDPRGWQRADAN